MISLDDLDRVLGWMLENGLQSLTVSEGDARLSLRLGDIAPGPAAGHVEFVVRTKAIGTFLLSHPRRPAPAVAVGDEVRPDTIVGFQRVGSVLVPVVAGRAGRVRHIHAVAGDLLGYGAPVLTLESEA